MSENIIKVLIVDDSAFMRTALERMLKSDPNISIIGSAANGKDAVSKAAKLRPDVITMDVEMPLLDGLQALKEIMRLCPTPVIMVSHLTRAGAGITLDALELGAVDFILKPGSIPSLDMLKLKDELVEKVHAVAGTQPTPTKYSLQKRRRTISSILHYKPVKRAVFIGASTGGPPAVQKILSSLPASLPAPIIVAQHMAKVFTAAYATRLNNFCELRVKELCNEEEVQNSVAYICPGDVQTEIFLDVDGTYKFKTYALSEIESRFAPSIDILFSSAAKVFASRAIGIILTGMGEDGVQGLAKIKDAGGLTMAQDKHSSVVYGMPRAAFQQGAAERVLNIDKFAPEIELALK